MTQQTSATDFSHEATTVPEKGSVKQRFFRSNAKDTLPMTICHERIYILPSRRGMAFICVIIIMLMASINYSLNLGYALCFILVGLFASCLLATYKNLVKLKFISINAQNTFAESDLNYKVRISEEVKKHRSSINLNNKESSTLFDTKPLEVVEATLRITHTKRGVHTLGRLTLSSNFPLGLWRGWGYLHTPVKAWVYPKPESPAVDFAGYSSTAGGTMAKGAESQEFSGLKVFETSDSLARVAWKRVASGTGWYSKQFEPEAEQREVAIRWQDTPAHLGTEQRLSRLCSWVIRARDENIAYTFELPGAKSLALASGREHYENCLRALATYNPDEAGPDKTKNNFDNNRNRSG